MKVAVPRERASHETRVAATPETVVRLRAAGFDVVVEAGAGTAALIDDERYQEAGAIVESDRAAVYASAAAILKVQPPMTEPDCGLDEILSVPRGACLISFLSSSQRYVLAPKLRAHEVRAFSLDLVPPGDRARPMDALSAMNALAGYKAVILGAHCLPRAVAPLIAAPPEVTPPRVLVIGVGVAGRQAIDTAHRLGACVTAADLHDSARQEVADTGATFLRVGADAASGDGAFRDAVSTADIIVAKATTPHGPAPILLNEEMVASMRPGSQIVDLAAGQGGNCALTRPGRTTSHGGVMVHGPLDLATAMPVAASMLYARAAAAFLLNLLRDGKLTLDYGDEIVRATCVTGC